MVAATSTHLKVGLIGIRISYSFASGKSKCLFEREHSTRLRQCEGVWIRVWKKSSKNSDYVGSLTDGGAVEQLS